MAITKATILSYVNSKLHLSETDIDQEIQEVLDELSEQNLLTREIDNSTIPATTDLAAGDREIAKPDLYKQLVAITLTDSSGQELRPLVGIPGGQAEYRRIIRLSPSQGKPEWYSEYHNKFFIYPESNGVYEVKMEFYKFHAGAEDNSGADDIEFGNEFSLVLKCGACLHVATRRRMQEQMVIWGQKYHTKLQDRLNNRTEQAYVVGGADGYGYD